MSESDSDGVNAAADGILSSFCDVDDEDSADPSMAAEQHMKTLQGAHEDLEGARCGGPYPEKSGHKKKRLCDRRLHDQT